LLRHTHLDNFHLVILAFLKSALKFFINILATGYCKKEEEVCSCHMTRYISMTILKDLPVIVSIVRPGGPQNVSF